MLPSTGSPAPTALLGASGSSPPTAFRHTPAVTLHTSRHRFFVLHEPVSLFHSEPLHLLFPAWNAPHSVPLATCCSECAALWNLSLSKSSAFRFALSSSGSHYLWFRSVHTREQGLQPSGHRRILGPHAWPVFRRWPINIDFLAHQNRWLQHCMPHKHVAPLLPSTL